MPKVCVEFQDDCDDDGLKTYTATVGDGVSTQFNVMHNLNTSDVLYSLRNLVTGVLDEFDVQVSVTGPNSLNLVFAAAPAANSVRVAVLAV